MWKREFTGLGHVYRFTLVQQLKNRSNIISLVILLVLAVLALMTRTDKFATMANFRVLLNGMSTDMMIAIPMAISLIAGNTDFSVGSSLCFSSMIAGSFISSAYSLSNLLSMSSLALRLLSCSLF